MSRIQGIDVSHWQGIVDWRKIGKNGIKFAFIKATEGDTAIDQQFINNIFGAWSTWTLGYQIIPIAYHYLYPRNDPRSISAQIDHFLNTVAEYDPVQLAIDVEESGVNSADEMARDLYAAVQHVYERLGIMPFIYVSPSFWDENIFPVENASQEIDFIVNHCPLWVAHYPTGEKPSAPRLPKGWRDWTVWQRTNMGRIDGISGDVDLNEWNDDYLANTLLTACKDEAERIVKLAQA